MHGSVIDYDITAQLQSILSGAMLYYYVIIIKYKVRSIKLIVPYIYHKKR
jgi:hypothetical protein